MGALYMLGSAFFFSVMSLLVKTAGQRLPSQEIVVARSVIGLLLSYWLVKRAGLRLWGRGGWRLLVLRGVFGFGALSCYFHALTRLPISETTVIQFTSPILTALLGVAILGERVGKLLALATVTCLVGVAMITRPAILFGADAAELDEIGVAVAVISAFLSAAAYITVRRLSKTEDPLVIVFYFALVATPASLVTAAPIMIWPRDWEWLLLIAVGVATQFGQVCLTNGLKLEPAGRATSIGYAQIVFATIWGAIFFAEIPGPWAIAGALLIASGTLAVALTSGITPPPPSGPPLTSRTPEPR